MFLEDEKNFFYLNQRILFENKIKFLFLIEFVQIIQFVKISTDFQIKLNLKNTEICHIFFNYNKDIKFIKNLTLNIFNKIIVTLNNFQSRLQISFQKKKNKCTEIQKSKATIEKSYKSIKKNDLLFDIRKISPKNFSYLLNLNLPAYQQNQGYFDSRGRRIKKFSMLWDEAIWIFFMFNSIKIQFNIKTTPILNFLENIYMILVYIQTGRVNCCFFYYIHNAYNTWMSEYCVQLILLYRIFILDRKWNNQFSIRQKTSCIIRHLEYTTDLIIDVFLDSRKIRLNLDKNKNIISKHEKYLKSFILKTKNKDILFDFFFINIHERSILFRKKIFILTKKKNLVYEQVCLYIKNTIHRIKYDIRFWHSCCLDSCFLKSNNKIDLGLFSILENAISLSSFGFLLSSFFRKTLQFLLKNDIFQLKLGQKVEYTTYSIKDLIENYWITKKKNQKYSIMSVMVFSKKRFLKEFKVFFKKLFGYINFSIKGVIFNIFYYILSNVHIKKFEQFFFFEIRLILSENFIFKFYRLFFIHGSNPFHKNKDKNIKILRNVCLLKIFDKSNLNITKRVNIYLSVGINCELKKIRKFEILINKNTFFDVLVFFCAKYRVNFIVLESSSFIERIVSIFLKLQLSDKSNFKKHNNCLEDFKNKFTFLSLVKVMSIEKNSIIYEFMNSCIIKELYSKYNHRLMFVIMKLLEENIVIFFYFISGQNFNESLSLNYEFFNFKFSLLYKILLFLFRFIFLKAKIDLIFCILKKNRRPLLKIINTFGIRNAEKLCKEFSKIKYRKNRKKILRFNKFLLKGKSFSRDHKFYFLSMIYIKKLNNCSYKDENFILYSSYNENRCNFSKIFNYPLLIKEVKKKFLRIFSSQKFLDIIHTFLNDIFKSKKDYFLTFINNFFLEKNFSYLIKISHDKINSYFFILEKKFQKFFINRRKLLLKSWKEKILSDHQIDQIILIDNIRNIDKEFIYGTLKTGFNYFINLKCVTDTNLKFSNFILKTFCVFPAKISAIYPKIMQIKLSLITKKNYILSIINSKKDYIFLSWLKQHKLMNNYRTLKKNLQEIKKIFKKKRFFN